MDGLYSTVCRIMKTHTQLSLLSIISSHAAYPESGSSSQTQFLFTGETAQLNCNTQPGRAHSLYRAEWHRNNRRIPNIPDTNFSLSVPVRDVSENGTVYQCTVTVRSCFPTSSISGCAVADRIAEGDAITLMVGGKCTQLVQVSTP